MDQATSATAAGAPGLGERAVLAIGRSLSSLFLALGTLGALRTGMDETAQLAVFTVSPSTAGTWLLLGIVGVAMTTGVGRCRTFLRVQGVLLVAWGLLGLALDSGPADLFVRDTPLVALHLITGAVSLASTFLRAGAGAAGATPPSTTPSGARD